MEELLSTRTLKNIVYDFSELSEAELKIYVHSGIFGTDDLTDSEMQLLESGSAKIIERHGKPRKHECDYPEFNPVTDDPEEWLKKRITWQQQKS